jgi:hypothetical protein
VPEPALTVNAVYCVELFKKPAENPPTPSVDAPIMGAWKVVGFAKLGAPISTDAEIAVVFTSPKLWKYAPLLWLAFSEAAFE